MSRKIIRGVSVIGAREKIQSRRRKVEGRGSYTPLRHTFLHLSNDEFALCFLHLISPYCSVQYTVTSRGVYFLLPRPGAADSIRTYCKKRFFLFVPEFSLPEKSSGLFGSLEGDLLHSQMPEKSSGPWKTTFYMPQYRKILVPGARPGLPPEARLLCHEAHSGDRKIFPAFGNAKGPLPGTRRVF